MRKSKLYKFISVLQILVFSLLLLIGLASLAMAIFDKFQVNTVIKFIDEKATFLRQGYLYIINFFDTIYYSLELNKLAFVKNIKDYLHIIYTGLLTFIALLGFIFGIVNSKAASGKTKGKGGAVFAFIINFIIAGAFTAFAVYYILNQKAIENVVNEIAISNFLAYNFEYKALINTIIIYAIAGTSLFIMFFNFIGLCIGAKGSSNNEYEPPKQKEKKQKQNKKEMGSYNPKIKPKEEDDFLTKKPADYLKYQDSKSVNPYINGKSELKEDDLFSDLKPKTQPQTIKPDPIQNDDFLFGTSSKPTVNNTNNPFANSASFVRPTAAPQNTFTQPQNTFTQPQNNFAQPQYNSFNAVNQANQMNGFNTQTQYNNFARPTQSYQPAQNPQAAPTNINLTISPNMQPMAQEYPQQNAYAAAIQPEAPKSANEAFKAAPKAPAQALVKPKATEQSLTDKLKELSALRQTGAISDDEYKALKQKAFQKFLKS